MFAVHAVAHPDRCELFVPRTPIWTSPDTYLEPDLFLVATERLRVMDAGRLTTADLVVEIMSPASAMYDRTAKADTYAALGVRELWLVDLERASIEQRVLGEETWKVVGTYSGSEPVDAVTFPGLRVVPRQLFP